MRVWVKHLSGRRAPVDLPERGPEATTVGDVAAAAGSGYTPLAAAEDGTALDDAQTLADADVAEGDTLHELGEKALLELAFLKVRKSIAHPDGVTFFVRAAAALGGTVGGLVREALAPACRVPAGRIGVVLGARQLDADTRLWDAHVESGEVLKLRFRDTVPRGADDIDDDECEHAGEDFGAGAADGTRMGALEEEFPALLL